ncbi:MAG: translation initiation factor IF-2, partial [Candidatus Aenigmatarchaeota archaeon]
LPNAIFRQSKPAIFGVEILAGTLKSGVLVRRKNDKTIGRIKEIQTEGRKIEYAKKGEKVAISIEEGVVGRNILENDILEVELSSEEISELEKLITYLTDDEKEILKNLKEQNT